MMTSYLVACFLKNVSAMILCPLRRSSGDRNPFPNRRKGEKGEKDGRDMGVEKMEKI